MAFFHIDTDMGVDDGLALTVASRLSGFTLAAISTVFGNVAVETATRNAILFRHLLGQDLRYEIIEGAARASDGFSLDARGVHGEDGLGGAASCLEKRLLEAVGNFRPLELARLGPAFFEGQSVTLIGLGPATNIPQLVAAYGRNRIERIVLMTGVFFDFGNITSTAEFNAHCDPRALRATLGLGIPTTIVPLDVCRKVQLSRATVLSYLQPGSSPLIRLVVASHMRYMDYYMSWEGIDGCFPHDTIAVLAAANPQFFFRPRAAVSVEVSGERRGRTLLTLDNRSHIEIVTGGNLKIVRDFLRDLQQGTSIEGPPGKPREGPPGKPR